MYRFSKIKMLRGELKRTEVRNNMKYQLTTKEFIQQRGQATYRIALENIIGVIECDGKEFSMHVHPLFHLKSESFGSAYKIVATVVHLVSPNEVIEQSNISFYTRLSHSFAQQLQHFLHKETGT